MEIATLLCAQLKALTLIYRVNFQTIIFMSTHISELN